MTEAMNVEKAMKRYINEAARETNVLRKRNEMFVSEPLASGIMWIAFKLGRASMCCDVLSHDFNQDTSDYKGIIKDIEKTAYETYKDITGGI